MKAIPTIYGGIRFRSRLEAKWACFFDALGWSWVYEPFDTNGWIPDFQLGEKLLIEIKPFRFKHDWCFTDVPAEQAISFLEKEYYPAENNSINSGYDLLWLGLDGVQRGVFGPEISAFYSSSFSPICFVQNNFQFDIVHLSEKIGLIHGLTNGDHSDYFDIYSKWTHAVNSTQWKGRRAS